MDWGNAYVRSKTTSPTTGLVTSLTLELHLAGDFKKTKKKITWLSSASSTNTLTPVTLLDFDYLITKKKLEEDDTIDKFIAPVTEFREEALADGNVLKDIKKGDMVQFERKGYFICDSVGEGEGKRWEFILIPDGRAATVESKAVMAKEKEEKAKGKAAGAPMEKVSKKERMAAAKKVAATEGAGAGLSPTRVVLSDATAGFEIPVSTMVSL